MNVNKYIINFSNDLRYKQFLRFLLFTLNLKKLHNLEMYLPDAFKFIIRSLQDAFTESISPDEKYWIESIEDLRNKLFSTSDFVDIEDYGSGDWLINFHKNDVSHLTKKSINFMCWLSAKPPVWCLFLMKLIGFFKPKVFLELGTNSGISSAYQAAALKLLGKGKIYTIEGSHSISDIANENFKKLSLNNISLVRGVFKDTLPLILSNLSNLDFVFIDGHHDGRATMKYYSLIKSYLNSPAILVFDDVYWSFGMKKAWDKIKRDTEFCLCLDLFTLGVCFYDPSYSKKRIVTIPLI